MDLPEKWVSQIAIEALTESVFFDRMRHVRAIWIPRSEAERTPSYKQIIPYVILRTKIGNLTACYRRKGSESRLHDLWSCGIGGHVNPVDEGNSQGNLKEILDRGLLRELDEELPSRPFHCRPLFQGIINEEKTEVGTVHFGLVYTIELTDPSQLIPGDELIDFTWKPIEAIRSLKFELWSMLALKLIGMVDK